MKNALLIAGLAVIVAACSSTGPVPISKDTYMISKQSAGGMFVQPASIRADIIREGAAFCMKSGKEFQIDSFRDTTAFPGRLPASEITFMCLDANDPELRRLKLRKDADTVIETRQR